MTILIRVCELSYATQPEAVGAFESSQGWQRIERFDRNFAGNGGTLRKGRGTFSVWRRCAQSLL